MLHYLQYFLISNITTMVLVFNKVHANQFREKDVKNLKNEIGSKVQNETCLTFNWNAAINGRFERKLNRFINNLPFTYFSCRPIISKLHSDNANLYFKQGLPHAKAIKHAILLHAKLNGIKL